MRKPEPYEVDAPLSPGSTLASFTLVVGGRLRLKVNYQEWLSKVRGEYITSVAFQIVPTAPTTTTTATADTLTYWPENESFSFSINGGSANDNFDVIVTVTSSLNQIRVDKVTCTVQAVT